MKKIAILGSTGSIGTQALDVIRNNPDLFRASVLSCAARIGDLEKQIAEFRPDMAEEPEPPQKKMPAKKSGVKKLGSRILGRPASGTPVPLASLNAASGDVVCIGDVFSIDSRVVKSGRVLAAVLFTDYKTSMAAKFFTKAENWESIAEALNKGDRIRVGGSAEMDQFTQQLVIMGWLQ